MPIKGLTDQQAALPIIGTLRKGDEKPQRGPGKDLTHFRFTADDPATLNQFHEAYGPEPRQINVFLPFKTTDENMDSWIEKWVAGGLEYRSDGETVVLWHTQAGYSTKERPDPQPEIGEDGKRADGSMQVGRLSVIVPEMGRLATITVLTTSKHDIINLTRQLRSIEAINGDLRGIPFVLRRSPKTISTPAGNGKRARREKWLLSIETHKRGTMAILGNMERTALAELAEYADDEPEQVMYQLPPGVSSPFEDDAQTTETKPAYNATVPAANGKPELREKLTYAQLKEKFNAFCGAMAERGFYTDAESGDKLPATMHKAGDKTPQIIAATVTKLLGGDKDAYHAALMNLTGKSSANDLTAIEAAGIFKILFNGADEITFKTEPIETAAGDLKVIAEQDDLPF